MYRKIFSLAILFFVLDLAGCSGFPRAYSSAHPRQESKAESCAAAAKKGFNETGCPRSLPSTWIRFAMPAVNGARSLSRLLQPRAQPLAVICTDKRGQIVECAR